MRRALAALFLIASLSGCASTWVVDSNVKSFSKLDAVPAGTAYRFERLPSQQAAEPQQEQLESMAGAALARVGLQRDDVRAVYSAQITARVAATLSPWADPWLYPPGWWPGYGYGYGYGYGPRYGRGWYGGGWYGSAFIPPAANPWYEREVGLVLRDLKSGQVVYETRARNDGPYASSGVVLAVMFDAALQGFPNPPPGERVVNIPLQPRP
ncbi:DUF4136 domain-containing protein [Variovorax sp. dw_308]|uniref:DUF4136 domain-containing protein n=1 Tax=Variovorax sp. dw_308 TaxID=2721546 RepID=UPI001C475D89|nr:DUF4136 domain-containing protein [Variovorax sp. dw_308]